MKKKFKVTLVVFLVIILGCFSEVFAADVNTSNTDLGKKAEDNLPVKNLQKNNQLSAETMNSSNTVWNTNDKDTDVNLSNNNLTARVIGGKSSGAVRATNYKTSGKWYWEISIDKFYAQGKYSNGGVAIGIANKTVDITNLKSDKDNNLEFYACKNLVDFSVVTKIYPNGKSYPSKYGQLYTTGDTIGIALDLDNKTVKFSVNGKWYDNIDIPSWDEYFPVVSSYSSITSLWQDVTANFGTKAFKNSVPEGFLPFDTYLATEISLNKTTDTLNVGGTDNLIATITPENAVNKSIKWTSSDSNIVSVDNNGEITALKKGTATITAATQDGSNLSASCAVTVNDPLILNIEPEKTKINLNDTVSANLTIDNIQDIAAEDIRIKYDSTKLKFLGYEQVDGIKLVKDVSQDGELRVILASKGKANIINAKKALLKLNFKGIAAGDALVDVTKGRVSDGITKEYDLTDEQCGQATITIQGIADVDNSGEYTLLDLAIDARHEGEDPSTLPQYNADQDGNKAIDDADLTEIGQKMLDNPNYEFNKEN